MSWWVRLEHADGKTSWLDVDAHSVDDPEKAHAYKLRSEAEGVLDMLAHQDGVWPFLVDAKDAPSNLMENQEFTCPVCGSHQFGTSFEDVKNPNGLSHGHCHGRYAVTQLSAEAVAAGHTVPTRPCSFSWPRTDDEKYFKGTGSFYPRVQTGQVVSRNAG